MAKVSKTTGSVKEVRHPFTNKLMKEVWVTGKGMFQRNTVYKVYNSVRNYEQLNKSDLNKIDWNKSK